MARRINFLPVHDELARVVPKRVVPRTTPSEVIDRRHNGQDEYDRGKQRNQAAKVARCLPPTQGSNFDYLSGRRMRLPNQ